MAQWSKEVFAANLRKYADRSGRTHKELAEIAGVSTATFSEWVNAKKYPRIDKIERLANYFQIQKSDLIEEKTTAILDGGYSDTVQELITLINNCPEEKAKRLLAAMKLILANDE